MQDKIPYFSVIMPVHNKKPHLRRSIQSVLGQSFTDFELLIVDDASTDDSLAVIRSFSDARIRILHRDTPGPAGYAARNLGIEEAKAHWVAFLDADDEWFFNHLDEAHDLTRDGRVDFASCGFLMDTGIVYKAPQRKTYIGHEALKIIEGLNVLCTNSVVVRKELFNTAGNFPAGKYRRGGDGDTWFRLILNARAVAVSEKVTSLYHTLASGVIANKKNLDTSHPVSQTIKELLDTKSWSREVVRRLKIISNKKSFLWAIESKKAGMGFRNHVKNLYPDALIAGDIKKIIVLLMPGYLLKLIMRGKAGLRHLSDTRKRGHNFFLSCRPLPEDVDICIVANLKFPGGNASSTIEEAKILRDRGFKVCVIHCPPLRTFNYPVSARYREIESLCYDYRFVDTDVKCKFVLARHPSVIASPFFARLMRYVKPDSAAFIINNSISHTDGTAAYSKKDFVQVIASLDCEKKHVFPVGPAIRNELEGIEGIDLAQDNWTPVFSVDDFPDRTAVSDQSPLRIGRHTRDSPEKWPEKKADLLCAYPDDPRFAVHILGGADRVVNMLGRYPSNWHVTAFGAMPVAQFLQNLDVFVYFPHSGLKDAFPRNVVEAMLAKLPCILPRSFEKNFGELALYCTAEEVTGLLEKIRNDPAGTTRFTDDVYHKAVLKFGSAALIARVGRLTGQAGG